MLGVNVVPVPLAHHCRFVEPATWLRNHSSGCTIRIAGLQQLHSEPTLSCLLQEPEENGSGYLFVAANPAALVVPITVSGQV